MADKKIQIRRYDGSSWSQIYPVTSYNYLVDVPTNFPPSAHTHSQFVYSGKCGTVAGTASKVLAVTDYNISGAIPAYTKIAIFFAATNTALNPTLKLSSSGQAYPLKLTFSKAVGVTEWESWPAGSCQTFMFHPDYEAWVMVGYRDITGAMQVANNTLELRKEN